jgi:hypothetical protein
MLQERHNDVKKSDDIQQDMSRGCCRLEGLAAWGLCCRLEGLAAWGLCWLLQLGAKAERSKFWLIRVVRDLRVEKGMNG